MKDLTKEFADGGAVLVRKLAEGHARELKQHEQQVQKTKEQVRGTLERALRRQDEEPEAQSVADVAKNWGKAQSALFKSVMDHLPSEPIA